MGSPSVAAGPASPRRSPRIAVDKNVHSNLQGSPAAAKSRGAKRSRLADQASAHESSSEDLSDDDFEDVLPADSKVYFFMFLFLFVTNGHAKLYKNNFVFILTHLAYFYFLIHAYVNCSLNSNVNLPSGNF